MYSDLMVLHNEFFEKELGVFSGGAEWCAVGVVFSRLQCGWVCLGVGNAFDGGSMV